MNNFKLISNDNSSCIEVVHVQYNIEEGYHPSVGFDLKIQTSIINYLGLGFWYNKSDIDNAISQLSQLENKENVVLNFNAFSEFILTIKMKDSVGHYVIEFSIDDHTSGVFFKSNFIIDYAVMSNFKTFLTIVQKGFKHD